MVDRSLNPFFRNGGSQQSLCARWRSTGNATWVVVISRHMPGRRNSSRERRRHDARLAFRARIRQMQQVLRNVPAGLMLFGGGASRRLYWLIPHWKSIPVEALYLTKNIRTVAKHSF